MGRIIRTDLKKVFLDYHIYLCMLSLGAVFILSYGELIRVQSHSFDFTSVYTMLSGNAIMLFCFLICVVGGVFLYCTEERYGYLYYEIQRSSIKTYTISKLITSLISGFVTAMTGFITNTFAIILFAYIEYEDKSLIWPSADELENFIWEIILFSMLCGILSAIGLVVAMFYANFFVAMTAPILIYYAILSLYDWIPVPYSLQISKVYLSVSSAEDSYIFQFLYALVYTACLLVILYKIAKKQIQRRIEHA